MKQTNYQKNKELILTHASHGVNCYNCPARDVCKALCAERKIDPSKQTTPCSEAWLKWADEKD